jgi:hypothetical protein
VANALELNPWLVCYGMIVVMTDRSDIDQNARLMEATRRYLEEPQDERIDSSESLRLLCSRLAGLLGRLLETEHAWNRYNWVDAIAPFYAVRASSSSLDITGLVIWGTRGTTKEWIEPFFASIQLSNELLQPITYKMFFADAGVGLGLRPYGSSQDYPQVPVTEWMFKFTSKPSHG